MNPDSSQPNPPEQEAQITALLLGELPAAEAAELQQAISRDPALAQLHERLRQTVDLLREAATQPAGEAPSQASPPRLSDERRARLLAAFRVVGPKEFTAPWRRDWAIYLKLAAAAAVIVLLSLGTFLPAGIKMKQMAPAGLPQIRLDVDVSSTKNLPQADKRARFDPVLAQTQTEPRALSAGLPREQAERGYFLRTDTESELLSATTRDPGGGPRGEAGGKKVAAGGAEAGPRRPGIQAGGFGSGSITGAASRGPEQDKLGTLGLAGGAGGVVGGRTGLEARANETLRGAVTAAGRAGDGKVAQPAPPAVVASTAVVGYGVKATAGNDKAANKFLSESADTPPASTDSRRFTLGKDLPPAALAPAAPSAGKERYEIALGDKPALGQVFEVERWRRLAEEKNAPRPPSAQALAARKEVAASVNRQVRAAGDLDALTVPPPAKPPPPPAAAQPSPTTPASAAGAAKYGLAKQERDLSRAQVDEAGRPSEPQQLSRWGRDPAKGARLSEAAPAVAAAEAMRRSGNAETWDFKPGAVGEGKELRQKLELAEEAAPTAPPALQVVAPVPPATPAPEPQPEVMAEEEPFSTFSLNVTDVSFRLAAGSLENGVMPERASIRSEEFINAFDYRDALPGPGAPVAFAWERAQYPFAHNRDLVRFSLRTAARGREPGRSLNLVLLLDNSGSMERADRVQIIGEALRVLAGQLQPEDRISVVAFARTARLWVDNLPGSQAAELVERVGNLSPEGGTNLEDALRVGYETALRHFLSQGVNRVILLTDGAANLGDVDPESLRRKVESFRQRGVALDCFGIGWEGYNDDLLEVLSRHGDGRYGFVNTPEEAATEFAGQLAGALQVAAADVKVQVEFNPRRVLSWRQVGYAKHQLTKEQFRDNTVDAAELAAAESGNALYVLQMMPGEVEPIGWVRVRYKVPATGQYCEQEWLVPYTGAATPLDQASPAMRLAATAAAFSEWLASSPFAAEVKPDRLLACVRGVPEAFAPDPRPRTLELMIRQAKAVSGQ
jgi:Mg-chelatase subunit ChlD